MYNILYPQYVYDIQEKQLCSIPSPYFVWLLWLKRENKKARWPWCPMYYIILNNLYVLIHVKYRCEQASTPFFPPWNFIRFSTINDAFCYYNIIFLLFITIYIFFADHCLSNKAQDDVVRSTVYRTRWHSSI